MSTVITGIHYGTETQFRLTSSKTNVLHKYVQEINTYKDYEGNVTRQLPKSNKKCLMANTRLNRMR